MKGYVSAKEAAQTSGLNYFTLLARVRSGKVKAERVGRAVLIPVKEVRKLKDANNKTVA